MPGRRTYARKPQTRRRRVARRKPQPSTAKWLATKAWQGVKFLKDVVNTEYKHYDLVLTGNYDFSGAIYPVLEGIAQGVQATQRVGSSIKVQNITFRAELIRNAADCNIRLIWYWDKQNTVTTTAQLLENVGTAYATISPKEYSNRFQTRVLMDRNYNLTTDTPQRNCNFVKPINLHCNYSGNSTTIDSGSLKLLIISDLTAANLPQVKFFCRISYTDN